MGYRWYIDQYAQFYTLLTYMVLCCPCLSASDKAALKAAFVPRKDISEEDLWLTLSQGNKPSDLSQAWFPTLGWFGWPWDYLWRRRQSNGCCSQSISSLGKGKAVCPTDALLSESTPWEEIAKGLGGHLTWNLVSFLPGAMKNDNHMVVFLLRPALRASVEALLGVICSERPGFLQLDHKRVDRCTGHYMFTFPFEGNGKSKFRYPESLAQAVSWHSPPLIGLEANTALDNHRRI